VTPGITKATYERVASVEKSKTWVGIQVDGRREAKNWAQNLWKKMLMQKAADVEAQEETTAGGKT
jgi:hypothetical protein